MAATNKSKTAKAEAEKKTAETIIDNSIKSNRPALKILMESIKKHNQPK